MNQQLYYNAKIITMDETRPLAEAMYVIKDLIVATGTYDEVLPLIKTADPVEMINCQQKTIMPGFNDSHMHLLGLGSTLQMVNLHGTTSFDDLITRGQTYITEHQIEKMQWVVGRGWNHDFFTDENRFPTRYDLDKISTQHPILYTRACGHIAVVNSCALSLLTLPNNLETSGGMIEVDALGEPTGVFSETAIDLITNHIPSPTDEQFQQMAIAAMKRANAVGITSIQSDDVSRMPNYDYRRLFNIFESLQEANQMTCRVHEQVLLPTYEHLNAFINDQYHQYQGGSYFTRGPLKLLSDGSLGGRTAALRHPYVDDPSTNGIYCYQTSELNELIALAHQHDLEVAVHAIGDGAIEQCLNSFEAAQKTMPKQSIRHGIVHCQITDLPLLKRFAQLNVSALVQPIFLDYDLHIVNQRVGKELAQTSYAFKTMRNLGITVGLGTDCPVEDLNTFDNLYCAVTRNDLKNTFNAPFVTSECLTIEEALYDYTMGSAKVAGQDQIKGSLSAGKLADFIILSQNPLDITSEQLRHVHVEATYVGGRCVYRHQ